MKFFTPEEEANYRHSVRTIYKRGGYLASLSLLRELAYGYSIALEVIKEEVEKETEDVK